jgi:hypothetical protein
MRYIKYGLHKAGDKLPDGFEIPISNGSRFGNGIYTTKIPLYAQMYASCYKWV